MRAFSLKDVDAREKGRQLPDQTKTDPTPPGHNSNFETDMLIFAGQIAKIEAEIDVLADKKTELRQTIKNAGYELAVFDMMRKKVDQEPETIEAWFGNLARYGRATATPAVAVATLSGGVTGARPAGATSPFPAHGQTHLPRPALFIRSN